MSLVADEYAVRYRTEVEERQLRKTMRKYYSVVKMAQNLEQEQIKSSLESVILELKMYEQGAQRYILTKEQLENDIVLYKKESEELGNELEKSINQLRDELYQLRAERKQKIEYDDLAKQASKLPSVEESKRTLEKIKNDMIEMEESMRGYDQSLKTLQNQFEQSISEWQKLSDMALNAKDQIAISYVESGLKQDSSRINSPVQIRESTPTAIYNNNSRPNTPFSSKYNRENTNQDNMGKNGMDIDSIDIANEGNTLQKTEADMNEDEEGELDETVERSDGEI
ncbi:hypothetical protein H4219_000664 [Mycoemilia scoparia]|uniref:Uncharacterized protein n=1 Tax=Mycoemilia scoparia TaxID=417184 RepID=A0A9W8DWB3_9FUNG|nr:hypothetical protein H4219_000664 [Mycoemilia scoparia]